ncbi:sigma-54 interaction domain-containing protein [Thiohalorhabdus sp.]|uniref:sigma-54 interaction domain-containing protein n=1 Tax=Thiohalorhabdus sp. TaxID=3094134 RepID=UPI002FC3D1DA
MVNAGKSNVLWPLLEDVVSYTEEGVIIADAEGDIIFQNPAAIRLLGQPSDDPIDRLSEIQGFNFRSSYLRAAIEMGEVDAAGQPSGRYVSFEETLNLDGFHRVLEFNTGMVETDQGEARLVLIRDCTDKRRLEMLLDPESKVQETNDPRMRSIYGLIQQAAPSEASILFQGESGTGKTELARLVHRLSVRASGPFVEVNCAAIPNSLLESELFGHKKGAFTGATHDRPGRLQSADGGTLFLDEVGEIPLDLQPKLLRAIEDREFEMVGSDKPVRVDVRIIAASNQTLRDMVDEATFRPDLFYRLAVIPVNVPPLRERPGDIKVLVNHFCKELGRYHASGDQQSCSLAQEAMHLMLDYPWPGNIRELRNAVEHGIILAGNRPIRPEDLPQDIQSFSTLSPESAAEPTVTALGEEDKRQRQEREIHEALQQANGSRSLAAHILGIDRSTLWRRMQRFGIH